MASMVEHAAQQANLVTHMQGLQQDANNQMPASPRSGRSTAPTPPRSATPRSLWRSGSFTDTINRHGGAIPGASQHAETTDFGSAAGFRSI